MTDYASTKGAAKAANRAKESQYDSDEHRYTKTLKPSRSATPDKQRGNVGDMRSGMEVAMGAHADKLHPAKLGSMVSKRPGSPRMMQ